MNNVVSWPLALTYFKDNRGYNMFTIFLLAVAAWMAVGINRSLDIAKIMKAKGFEFLMKFATRDDIRHLITLGVFKDSARIWRAFDKLEELRKGQYYEQIRCMDRKVIGRLVTAMFVIRGALYGPLAKNSPQTRKNAKAISDYCIEKHPLSR